MRRAVTAICLALLCAACSEPPQKEIERAQGAIDAARAAGAEQYAPEAFGAATEAMEETHEAVRQRDYRLALSRAIDANERALEAATQAADGKARARSEAEVALTQATAALQGLDAKLEAAAAARVPARQLKASRTLRGDAERAVQEARAALEAEHFPEVTKLASPLPGKIAAEVARLDDLIAARPQRRRR